MKLKTRIKMPKFRLNKDKLQLICVSSLQFTGYIMLQIMDNYTLKDTGALRQSRVVTNTKTGLSIAYDASYTPYVYHSQRIKNVTTPGTTPFWDDATFSSAEFAQYTEGPLSVDISRRLNNNLDVFIKE